MCVCVCVVCVCVGTVKNNTWQIMVVRKGENLPVVCRCGTLLETLQFSPPFGCNQTCSTLWKKVLLCLFKSGLSSVIGKFVGPTYVPVCQGI